MKYYGENCGDHCGQVTAMLRWPFMQLWLYHHIAYNTACDFCIKSATTGIDGTHYNSLFTHPQYAWIINATGGTEFPLIYQFYWYVQSDNSNTSSSFELSLVHVLSTSIGHECAYGVWRETWTSDLIGRERISTISPTSSTWTLLYPCTWTN